MLPHSLFFSLCQHHLEQFAKIAFYVSTDNVMCGFPFVRLKFNGLGNGMGSEGISLGAEVKEKHTLWPFPAIFIFGIHAKLVDTV